MPSMLQRHQEPVWLKQGKGAGKKDRAIITHIEHSKSSISISCSHNLACSWLLRAAVRNNREPLCTAGPVCHLSLLQASPVLFLAFPLTYSLSSLCCFLPDSPPIQPLLAIKTALYFKNMLWCSKCWPKDAPPPCDPTALWEPSQPGLGCAMLGSACTTWGLSCISGFIAVLGSQNARKWKTCH